MTGIFLTMVYWFKANLVRLNNNEISLFTVLKKRNVTVETGLLNVSFFSLLKEKS